MVARATARHRLTLAQAWALTPGQFRLLEDGADELATLEYELMLSAAWWTGALTNAAMAGKIPSHQELLRRYSPTRRAEARAKADKLRAAEKRKGEVVVGFLDALARMRRGRPAADLPVAPAASPPEAQEG